MFCVIRLFFCHTAGFGFQWLYEGQTHGFFNERKNPEAFLDTVAKMDTFLAKLGWIEGEVDHETLHGLLKEPLDQQSQD